MKKLKTILDKTQLMDMDPPQGLPNLKNMLDFGNQATYQMFSQGMPELLNEGQPPTSLVIMSETNYRTN